MTKHIRLTQPKLLISSVAFLLSLTGGLQANQTITLHNPLSWTRPAADVVIHRHDLRLEKGHTVTGIRMNLTGFVQSFPFQLDDVDGDGEWDELYFQAALHGDQTVTATVETGPPEEAPSFKARTAAMPDAAGRPDVTKPAWESEVMTYVSYGAAQVDAIGKVAPRLSIDFLYKEPTHSQHAFTVEHGMDFMSVGNTMGAHAPFVQEPDGTIVRPWTTDAYVLKGPLKNDAVHTTTIISEGPLRAIVETRIDNWSTDHGNYACTLRYSIGAKQRHTTVTVSYYTFPEGKEQPLLGAGVRAFPEDLYVLEAKDRLLVASRNILERSQMVPWMGRAIVAADHSPMKPLRLPNGSAPENVKGDGPNYGVLFPEAGTEVSYAFIASWSLDDTITSWEHFQTRVDRLQQELSHPVDVTLND